MKTAFPFGSTAVILLLLAIVTRMKAYALLHEARRGLKLENLQDENAIAKDFTVFFEGLNSTVLWSNASNVFMVLSLLLGLYWRSQRFQRSYVTNPTPKGADALRKDRRRRR